MSEAGGLSYSPQSEVEDLDSTRGWYAAEIIEDQFEMALEAIGPVSSKMRTVIFDLYTYYTANNSRSFVVFEYDCIDEDIVSYLILPVEIFEQMWRFKRVDYDVWNEVERIDAKEVARVECPGEWTS